MVGTDSPYLSEKVEHHDDMVLMKNKYK